MVAWALVTASIVWGLALSSRLVTGRGVGPWLLDLHRYLGTLALVFTTAHVGSLLFDSYVGFDLGDLLIPFSSPWRTRAVAWGIVGFYLLVLVQVTSWLKRRIPKRLWHAVHLTSIPLFVTSSVHGALAGADRANRLVQWVLLTGIVLVVFMLVYRIVSAGAPTPAPARVVVRSQPPAGSLAARSVARPALPAVPVRPTAAVGVGLRREPVQLEDGTVLAVRRQLPAGDVLEVAAEEAPVAVPVELEPAPALTDEQAARIERLRRRRA